MRIIQRIVRKYSVTATVRKLFAGNTSDLLERRDLIPRRCECAAFGTARKSSREYAPYESKMKIDDDTLKQLLRINDELLHLCKWLHERRDTATSSLSAVRCSYRMAWIVIRGNRKGMDKMFRNSATNSDKRCSLTISWFDLIQRIWRIRIESRSARPTESQMRPQLLQFFSAKCSGVALRVNRFENHRDGIMGPGNLKCAYLGLIKMIAQSA
jgi:hypothetical protein